MFATRAWLKTILALIFCIGPTSCIAQPLEKSSVFAEAIQHSKSGEFQGCGIYLNFIRNTGGSTADYITLTLSFLLHNPSVGIMRTTYGEIDTTQEKPPKVIPITATWARIKPNDPLTPKKTIKNADGSILQIIPLKQAMPFLDSAETGKSEIQVGIRRRNANFERIFYGKPEISKEAFKQLNSCFSEFYGRLPL